MARVALYDFGAVREVRSSSFLRDTRSDLSERFGRKARGRVGVNPAGGETGSSPLTTPFFSPTCPLLGRQAFRTLPARVPV